MHLIVLILDIRAATFFIKKDTFSLGRYKVVGAWGWYAVFAFNAKRYKVVFLVKFKIEFLSSCQINQNFC